MDGFKRAVWQFQYCGLQIQQVNAAINKPVLAVAFQAQRRFNAVSAKLTKHFDGLFDGFLV